MTPSLSLPPLWRAAALMRASADRLERHAAPLVDLGVRLAMAPIFFRSGLQKMSDWPATVFLFEYEYQVPVLPPVLAAALATATELTMPVLLVLGLGTRLAALPLLVMTLVIQFAVASVNPSFYHPQHYLWMVMLAGLVVRGGGTLSLDHLVTRRLFRDHPGVSPCPSP